MWSIHDQPLKQDPGHLLLYGFNLGLREEGEEGTREVVGVGVGVPQLVGNGVEEEVATYTEEKQNRRSWIKTDLLAALRETYFQERSEGDGFIVTEKSRARTA